MAVTTRFSLVTPAAVKFEGDAQIVVICGAEGDFAALPRHAPMLTTLRTGVVQAGVLAGDGAAPSRVEFAVDGGFVQVLPDRVTVLTDRALARAEIDVAAARADLKRAQDELAQNRGGDDVAQRHAIAWAEARVDATHAPT